MDILIATITILIIGSAIFSCSEAALFSAPLNKVKVLEEKNKKGASSLLEIKKNMRPSITVLVVFTNLFNVAGSALVGMVTTQTLGSAKVGIVSAILTFLVIVFAEIIPKTIGDTFAVPISLKISKPILLATKILRPFTWFIEKITTPFPQKTKQITEGEIKTLSRLGYLEGVIEKDEKDMINRVFMLNDLKARDIMTPRTVINAIEAGKSLSEIEERIYETTHSRIPIYKENLDKIKGICHRRDILVNLAKDQKDKKIEELMNSEIITVKESIKIDRLIPIFQKKRCHLAIVEDKFGGTSGVVTLEDVLEQIIGEVVDEFDKEVDLRKKAKRLNSSIIEN